MPHKTSVSKLAALAATLSLGTAAPALADAMADAEALLAKHSALPEFIVPGEPFDARACMADKKVMSIPLTMTVPYGVELEKGMATAAAEVGFTFETWDNQLKIDQWIQGVSQAVAQDYDVIDLAGGINPELLGPQLSEARDAGIKISTTQLYDVTQEAVASVDASSKIDFTTAGKILAAWAYVKTEGKPNVVIIGSSDVLSSKPYTDAMEAQLAEYCPDCKARVIDVPVSEWATKIQASVQSAVLSDPGVNYILPVFDSMSQFIVPALRITGSEGAVKIASFNGTPFVLDMIREGTVDMDIGESLEWAGYTAIDNIMRMVCDLPEPQGNFVPLYIFDSANVETAGVPATYNDGYGDAYLTGFRKLWMLEE
ncbi:sugar ABC transporter substrate-binding protein [Salipiger sp. P9]|uniref:sugar ABC transporter substrate-binding protein n=1 Tax=Salipiger pentaromativorans TaxID=2943193 RepID=UPI0021577C00|nr:sugar ABC transporter substrate-binding protein [Salipiger pentaromativorans]MCR8547498.1 sugar ABC transporter substrate-binding protein [Salipiger pentaromativorans]